MNKTLLLFIVIIIEGYAVLATELLAIRQIIPYVGSGTDIVSIIIAAVLMPLAVGYYYGGRYRPFKVKGKLVTVRRKLIRNILIAATILLPGLSYFTIQVFFITLLSEGIGNRILMTTLYALIFLVTPVFLLGQTVPLVSNFFSSQKLSRITGKMLFCSTTGSFLGAIVSTLVLMTYAGVSNTVNAVFLLLAFLVFILSKSKLSEQIIYMAGLTAVAVFLNSPFVLKPFHIVQDNAYNTTSVVEDEKGLHLIQNNNDSSLIGPNGEHHPYVEFVERHYIDPTFNDKVAPKKILVVGAAGFTFGIKDLKNDYTYVDIDKDIRKTAEQYFLKQKLGPNKRFVGEDIRSFLTREPQKYDLIFLDAFLGNLTLPEQLATREFFLQVRNALKPDGIMVANFIASPSFRGTFSQNIDNTLRSVFPHLGRQVIQPDFDGWATDEAAASNLIYSWRNNPAESSKVYTDDKNQVSLDKPRKNPIAYFLEQEKEKQQQQNGQAEGHAPQ